MSLCSSNSIPMHGSNTTQNNHMLNPTNSQPSLLLFTLSSSCPWRPLSFCYMSFLSPITSNKNWTQDIIHPKQTSFSIFLTGAESVWFITQTPILPSSGLPNGRVVVYCTVCFMYYLAFTALSSNFSNLPFMFQFLHCLWYVLDNFFIALFSTSVIHHESQWGTWAMNKELDPATLSIGENREERGCLLWLQRGYLGEHKIQSKISK